MTIFSRFHQTMAMLHGGGPAEIPAGQADQQLSLACMAYAEAVAAAARSLQEHGKHSAEFIAADISGMRHFHKVKKLQGMKRKKGQFAGP